MKHLEGYHIVDIGGVLQGAILRGSFEIWLMGLWMIWKELCEEKHGGNIMSNRNLQLVCENYLGCYGLARKQAANQAKILPAEGSAKWISPEGGRFRLDVDYVVNEIRGAAGIGAIARDGEGRIIFALAKPILASPTVVHGELRAVMHGICQCIEEAISPVEVFTDSLLVVHVIDEGREVHGVLNEDLIEFFFSVKELNVISVNHVRREANKAAHELASLAKSLNSTIVWHDN